MGSGNFIKFVVEVASGPLLSLIYPLFFTIQAVENGAAADNGPLLKYWSIYSGLALIEYTFDYFLDWLPWDILLAVINVFLIIPHFNGATFVYQHLKAKLLETKTNPSGLLADAPPFLSNLLNDQLGIMASLGKFFNSALQSLTSAFSGAGSTQSSAFRSMPPRSYTHYSPQNLQRMDIYDAPEDEYSRASRSRSYSMRNPTLHFNSNQDSRLDNGTARSESMRNPSFNRDSNSTNDYSQSYDGSTSGRLKTVPWTCEYGHKKFTETKAPKERDGNWRRWPTSRAGHE